MKLYIFISIIIKPICVCLSGQWIVKECLYFELLNSTCDHASNPKTEFMNTKAIFFQNLVWKFLICFVKIFAFFSSLHFFLNKKITSLTKAYHSNKFILDL